MKEGKRENEGNRKREIMKDERQENREKERKKEKMEGRKY